MSKFAFTHLIAALALLVSDDDQPVAMRIEAPEITAASDWINSKPLKLADLRGKVVVVHFWTSG